MWLNVQSIGIARNATAVEITVITDLQGTSSLKTCVMCRLPERGI